MLKGQKKYIYDVIEENDYIDELCFKQTISFLYSKCVKRVNAVRKIKNIKIIDVCKSDDKSIVSNFFNGKCTDNNKFLITNKLMGYTRNGKHYATNSSGELIGIKHSLGFNSRKEILWGTDKEIENYLDTLYLLIMNEIPKYCSEYYATWETVLFDYVPYSKYKTLYEMKNDLNFSLLNTYGINDEELSETKIAIHQINAIIFWFKNENFKNDFKTSFIKFAESQKSFTNIDTKFKDNFIIREFIPILQKYKPKHETSLGLRVRDLLNNDLRSVPELLFSGKNEETQEKIKRMKNLATSRYITELEKIQEMEFGYLFS